MESLLCNKLGNPDPKNKKITNSDLTILRPAPKNSFQPNELKKLVSGVRLIENAMGDGQKRILKDEIINVMMPKALTKSSLLHGIIDMKDKMLWLNTTSATKADMFLSSLREVLGSLPATKPQLDSPSDIMTSWLSRGYVPENFEIEDACMMVDPNIEGGTIRCKKQDLQSQNIQSFIRDGCRIQQVSMKWQDQLAFVLCHDFSLKGLRFLDAVKDAVDDVAAESPEQQFDADFYIMTEALPLPQASIKLVNICFSGLLTLCANRAA